MNFDRTEEQQILAESVRRFAAREYDFAARRTIIASDAGYSADAWMTMASLGLLGLPFPPECGGSGGGALDLMGVMEIFGDALVVEPYLATVGLGAQLVARSGTPEQRNEILPAVCAGTLKLAFAQTERQSRYNPAHVATRASKTARGYRIDGEKRVVLHACCADRIVVSARTSGADSDATGISLFLIDPAAAGVTIRPYRTLDSMRAADVSLDNVNVPIDALLGSEHEGLPLIEEVIDYATALLCAEAVGAINYANQATLDYLKTRKQFGVPIGSFQALQHRMLDMTISGEQATSMASLACNSVDSERDAVERKRVVSAAKLRIAQACRHVAQESIQLHGGMGMSDEVKVSHTFRRLTTIAQQFGDAEHHLERFARLSALKNQRAAPM